VAVLVALGGFGWSGGLAVGVLGALAWVGHARVAPRARAAAVADAMPELADLFVIAAGAGHPVAGALDVVAPRSPTPVRPALVSASMRLHRGRPLDECLAQLATELGPAVVPLTDVLRQAATSGASLGPPLTDVAASARDTRRRSAQEAARRLPVAMLLPLAGCILPAAVLLAVVPVVLVSLASLSG